MGTGTVSSQVLGSRDFRRFEEILGVAGIGISLEAVPGRPQDLIIRDERLLKRVKQDGLVGLGEAYMDGWWDCASIPDFFERALRANLPEAFAKHPKVVLDCKQQQLTNRQSPSKARKNIAAHYNLGNDVFEATLDPYMQYTCGYWPGGAGWPNEQTLDGAQVAKLDLICRKLGLQPGMTVLDLGCGWGGFARYAAARYAVDVTGVTLSQEQIKYCSERNARWSLEFRLQDYRDTTGQFDRVVSAGMLEHVGQKNYDDFFKVVHQCLKPDGLALIHFFGTRDPFPNTDHSEVMWVEKYIFPGLVVPSLGQVSAAIDRRFVLEDLHNFGAHYYPTLMAWAANFERNYKNLDPNEYDERFYRMWRYYLLSCAGAFRARRYQLWQFVLSPEGVPGGYVPVR